MSKSQHSIFQHVTENFGMFGFGNPDVALLQACKELIDNSTAACIYGDISHPEISICLTQDSGSLDYINLEVIDNGCGIAELDSVIAFFSSHSDVGTTESHRAQIKGKYGVGLTASMLYSQIQTGQPIRIITKTPSSTCTMLDIAFFVDSGKHLVSQKSIQTHISFESGTRVRFSLPFPSDIHGVLYGVETYLERLNFLPSSFVVVSLVVDTESPYIHQTTRFGCCTRAFSATCVSIGGENRWTQALRVRASTGLPCEERQLDRDPSPFTTHTDGGRGDYVDSSECEDMEEEDEIEHERTCTQGEGGKRNVVVSVCAEEVCLGRNEMEQDVAEVTASIIAYLGTSRAHTPISHEHGIDDGQHENDSTPPNARTTTSSATGSTTSTSVEGYPLELWRYANGSPLLDQSDDALSCVFTSALKAVHWSKRFGVALKVPSTPVCPIDRASSISGGSSNQSFVNAAKWVLVPVVPIEESINEETALSAESSHSGTVSLKSVTVLLNIKTHSVPYANMAKTSIGQDRALLLAAKTAITGAMDRLQQNLASIGCVGLMPKADRLKDQMRSQHVPTVARSVARMIHFSQSSSFQHQCLCKLGLSPDRLDEVNIAARITARMLEIMDNNDSGN